MVANTIPGVANPTEEAAGTTTSREVAAAVAAGNCIPDKFPTRPTFLRADIQRAKGPTFLQTFRNDGNGQERTGENSLAAGMTFGF